MLWYNKGNSQTIYFFKRISPMKAKMAKCGASNPPAQKPKMNMGGYMEIKKPKKLGAYGGAYMKKKKK
jgi:hypothetical protein